MDVGFPWEPSSREDLQVYYFNTTRVHVNRFLMQFIKKSSKHYDPFTYIMLLLTLHYASDDNAVTCGGSWSLSGIM